MGNKKREHVVFDRMERVKDNINKKNFNQSNKKIKIVPKSEIKKEDKNGKNERRNITF